MRKTGVGQGMSVGVPNKIRGWGIAREVDLIARLAPCALRIPIPGFDVEFRVLPIGDGLPARGQHLLEDRVRKKLVSCRSRYAIDTGAQRFRGTKRIARVFRSDIHMQGLGSR